MDRREATRHGNTLRSDIGPRYRAAYIRHASQLPLARAKLVLAEGARHRAYSLRFFPSLY